MSEAYRIKRFHHVTGTKHKRLRDEMLIPLIANLPNEQLMLGDVDELLSTEESMALKMDEIDALEEQLYTIQNLLEGDWLIDFIDSAQPAYIMKFKRYVHLQHKHLYIKHFGQVSHVFRIMPHDMPKEVFVPLFAANHLGTLPLSVSDMLDKYEILALAQEEQELQNAQKKLQHEQPNTVKSRKQSAKPHNGEVKIIRAAYIKP